MLDRDSSNSSRESAAGGGAGGGTVGLTGRRKRGRGGANIEGTGEDAKNRRLEKNRKSAKESRLRKKQYMGHLEERNKVLEK